MQQEIDNNSELLSEKFLSVMIHQFWLAIRGDEDARREKGGNNSRQAGKIPAWRDGRDQQLVLKGVTL